MLTTNKKIFSRNLKAAIKNAGYTQEEFKEKSGVGSSLSGYLNTNSETLPNSDSLIKMVQTLNISIDSLFDDEETSITFPQTITPKTIINAINTLTEAYTYDCIEKVQIGEEIFDPDSGHPRSVEVDCYAICIRDQIPQIYLRELKTKGHLKNELTSVGEKDTYFKLLKKWADIDDKCFCDGHIVDDFDALFEEVDFDEE